MNKLYHTEHARQYGKWRVLVCVDLLPETIDHLNNISIHLIEIKTFCHVLDRRL